MAYYLDKYWIAFMFMGPVIGFFALATIVKYIEVRRARSWLAVKGRIIKASSQMRPVRTGDRLAEMRAFADVAYEFTAHGKTQKGTRVSIGEDLGNGDVAGTLIRFRPGTEVTVYFDPDDPSKSVLEREPPAFLFRSMGLLLLALVSGTIVAVDGTAWIASGLRKAIPNPNNVPFVMGFSFFALACVLMARAIRKQTTSQQAQAQGIWILWMCAAGLAAAAYWFATTSGGKI